MTGEKLHDALTLLPADLIEETDEMRRGKKKGIPLRRYAALAACLALVLMAGFLRFGLTGGKSSAAQDMESAMAAPEAPAEAANAGGSLRQEESQWELETAPASVTMGEAGEETLCSLPPLGPREVLRVLTPLQEDAAVNLESAPRAAVITTREGLDAYLDANARYFDLSRLEREASLWDEEWFREQDLLLITLPPYAADAVWEVRKLEHGADGWTVTLSLQDEGDQAPMSGHLIAVMTKGLLSGRDLVTVKISGQ